jgi:hypothetical protein
MKPPKLRPPVDALHEIKSKVYSRGAVIVSVCAHCGKREPDLRERCPKRKPGRGVDSF